MKRQFFKHGLVYGGANVISSMGTIVLVPIYARALQPSEYGVVDFLAVVQSLVQVCAGLEITQGIARFYAAAETDADQQAYASTGLWFLLASVATVCVLLYAAGRVFGAQFLGLGQGRGLFEIALFSVYVRILFYALQGQARWELRSALYSAASFIVATCTIGAVAYLLLVQHAGLIGVFTGLSLGYGAGCVFCLVSLRHTYRLVIFDWKRLRQMLRFSLPLTFSSLALFFANYGDRIILRSALGFHELGVYGIGARLAAVITLVINGFQLGAAPLIYRHYTQPETPAALAQLMRLFLAAGLLGVVSLAAFSIELLQVFTTPQYAGAWRLIPVLALAIVVANLYIFVPGLTVRNMTTRFAFVNVATAGITLLLIAVFLRLFGVLGAALGVLSGAAAGFVMHATASQQVYAIPLDRRRLAGGIFIAALAIAVSWALGSAGGMSFGLRVLLFVSASFALVAVLVTSEERALAQRSIWTFASATRV